MAASLRRFAAAVAFSLAAAAVADEQVPSSTAPFLLTDAAGLGPRFDGVGAISGGGATSRFLPDYAPAVLGNILDFLFLPNFGAALHIFKVEIGGEALATEGSEPTHMRTADETPNYSRGYEWMLMREAKRRNPAVINYGLPWTWPGWVGDAYGQNPWENVTLAAQYVVAWVKGAAAQGTPPSTVGTWNERPYSAAYVKELRRQLDAAGYANVSILCDDGRYLCVPDMLKDPELAAAVAIVGGHGPAPAGAGAATGKPIWFSEDFHAQGGESGAVTWASQINRRYLAFNMTATIAWNMCDAFFAGLSFDSTGLMTANSPWSGSYEVLGTIWATAHTTQFTQPGMRYLPLGNGSGWLAAGGSYVTYLNATDFTLVVEKPSTDPGAAPETPTFCLGGSLLQLAARAGSLRTWYSSFGAHNGENATHFQPLPALTLNGGCFQLPVCLDCVLTVTTSRAGGHGDHGTPPPAAPFPFPYADGFEGCVPPAEGRYWSDVSGAWECVADAQRGGVVMRQMTPAKPISWEKRADSRPVTVLGDLAWADVNFTAALSLSAAGETALLGVRVSLLNASNYAALLNEFLMPGLWLALNATGGWSVWPSTAAVGNWSAPGPLAQGVAAAPLAPGSWHAVSLVASGTTLAAALDGAPLFTALDVSATQPSPAGWVGMGVGEWGQFVAVDDVSIAAPATAQ